MGRRRNGGPCCHPEEGRHGRTTVGVSDVGIGGVVAKDYYVYIMTNKSGTLYTDVTNDLEEARVRAQEWGRQGIHLEVQDYTARALRLNE